MNQGTAKILVVLLITVIVIVVIAVLVNSLASTPCKKTPGTYVYDAEYIIVGAGAAGSVLAGRLLNAGHTVLVLEAGPDTSPTSTDPNVQDDIPNVQVPINFTYLWNLYNRIPTSTNCGHWEASDSLLDFVSTNQYPGRYYAYPRGCGAGGSASHHAMQDGRGSLAVYREIAKYLDDPTYSVEKSKARFEKMENYNVPGASANHGFEGWLHVRAADALDNVQQAFIDTAVSMGVPYKSDFSSTEEWEGVGPANVAVGPDGLRSYSYKDILMPALANNLGKGQVIFNCLVDSVVFDSERCDGQLKAVGVKTYNKAYLQEFQTGGSTFVPFGGDCQANRASFRNSLPTPKTYYASKEVIICGGAIQSPTVLLRSGIGPCKHLETVGIETLIDLPGVGSDVSDHTELEVIYEFDPRKYVPSFLSTYYAAFGLINFVADPVIKANMLANANTNVFNGNTSQMQLDWHSGVPGLPFFDLHMVPYPLFAWFFDATLDSPYDPQDPNGPRLQRQLLPNPLDPLNFHNGVPTRYEVELGQYNPADPRVYITWLVESMQPEITEGTVRLKSKDPRISPILDEKLYRDDKTLERIAHGVKFIRKIMENPSVSQYAVPGRNFEFSPGPLVDSIEDIKEYVRNWSSYGHHISSTCQMTKSRGGNGVCNSKMKVWGTKNLRVCDTSVYPPKLLHAFNTSRGAYYMAETLAELILCGQ